MDERFWIDIFPVKEPYGRKTLGIVDERAGGVIAYVGSEQLAKLIVKLLNLENEK